MPVDGPLLIDSNNVPDCKKDGSEDGTAQVIVATYAGAVIFMTLSDGVTSSRLEYLFFPNWTIAVILLLTAPFACIFSIELNIIMSSKVGDIRAAQQSGVLVLLPLFGISVGSEVGFLPFTPANLVIISAIILVTLHFVSLK